MSGDTQDRENWEVIRSDLSDSDTGEMVECDGGDDNDEEMPEAKPTAPTASALPTEIMTRSGTSETPSLYESVDGLVDVSASWKCTQCTTGNQHQLGKCGNCGAPNPALPGHPLDQDPSSTSSSDSIISDQGTPRFGTSPAQSQETPRPDIGEQPAEVDPAQSPTPGELPPAPLDAQPIEPCQGTLASTDAPLEGARIQDDDDVHKNNEQLAKESSSHPELPRQAADGGDSATAGQPEQQPEQQTEQQPGNIGLGTNPPVEQPEGGAANAQRANDVATDAVAGRGMGAGDQPSPDAPMQHRVAAQPGPGRVRACWDTTKAYLATTASNGKEIAKCCVKAVRKDWQKYAIGIVVLLVLWNLPSLTTVARVLCSKTRLCARTERFRKPLDAPHCALVQRLDQIERRNAQLHRTVGEQRQQLIAMDRKLGGLPRQITCATNAQGKDSGYLKTLGDSIVKCTKAGDRFDVECPSRCAKSTYAVYGGDNMYTTDSSICRAAFHHFGAHQGSTRIVGVRCLGERSNFKGTSKFGITSFQWTRKPWQAFALYRSTVNEPVSGSLQSLQALETRVAELEQQRANHTAQRGLGQLQSLIDDLLRRLVTIGSGSKGTATTAEQTLLASQVASLVRKVNAVERKVRDQGLKVLAATSRSNSQQDSKIRMQDAKIRTQDSKIRVQDSRIQAQESKVRTQDAKIRLLDSRIHSRPASRKGTQRAALETSFVDRTSATLRQLSNKIRDLRRDRDGKIAGLEAQLLLHRQDIDRLRSDVARQPAGNGGPSRQDSRRLAAVERRLGSLENREDRRRLVAVERRLAALEGKPKASGNNARNTVPNGFGGMFSEFFTKLAQLKENVRPKMADQRKLAKLFRDLFDKKEFKDVFKRDDWIPTEIMNKLKREWTDPMKTRLSTLDKQWRTRLSTTRQTLEKQWRTRLSTFKEEWQKVVDGLKKQGSCKTQVPQGSSKEPVPLEPTTNSTPKPAGSAPKPQGPKPKFVGCYQDSRNRDFKHGPRKYGYTIATCKTACKAYRFFALQNNGWCSCDNSYAQWNAERLCKKNNAHPKKRAQECGRPCAGETSLATRKYCGSGWRNAVYDTAKPELRAQERAARCKGLPVGSRVKIIKGSGMGEYGTIQRRSSGNYHVKTDGGVLRYKLPTSVEATSKQPSAGSHKHGRHKPKPRFKSGQKVTAQWKNNRWYGATVIKANTDGSFALLWDDGYRSAAISVSKIKAKTTAGSTQGRPKASGKPKASASAKWDCTSGDCRRKATRKFKRGDRIVVMKTLQADGKMKTLLRRGLVGKIDEIDHEGDALINFDALPTRQWIKEKNFHKLALK